MCIVQVDVIGRHFDIVFTHRLDYVAVAFIHVFLGKIMQDRDDGEDAERYWHLVIMPVYYAKPDALLIARPNTIPSAQQADKTRYGDFKRKSGWIVKLTSARLAPM